MNQPRPCGCKGRRTCLICEESYEIVQDSNSLDPNAPSYIFCPFCNLCYSGWDANLYKKHPFHDGEPLKIDGIYVETNFLSDEEHDKLMEGIDSMPWDLSQSGRRKQNFGPKCNFRKQKLRLGDFRGFPKFSKFVQEKFQSVEILKNFQTIEQCSLEYDPQKGASIDPHVDDCWIWGERVVTVNLLSDSVLTLTYNKKPEKYNLNCVEKYPKVLTQHGKYVEIASESNFTNIKLCDGDEVNDLKHSFKLIPIHSSETYPIIRIPMPKNSLIVIYDTARYNWEHRVLRQDICERRVCLAYREFTPPFLQGGQFWDMGHKVITNAKYFW